jgi:MSHA pilin protein MshA
MEKGFTLIELVIVMVVLGILAAVAVPKFQSLSTEAGDAAKAGGVSSVASAMAIEAAKSKGAPTGASIATALPGSACSAGKIEITGQGSNIVSVTLVTASGAATACTTAIVSVGTGVFSS